jgi:ribonuclease PH
VSELIECLRGSSYSDFLHLIEGGQIAEVQATAEGATYDEEGLLRLLRLAKIGCDGIFEAQLKATQ